MSTAIAERPDPEQCQHLWELILNMVGRPVELYCPRCDSTDQDIWPPGGIADLVTWDVPGGEIQVAGARHNATTLTSVPVNIEYHQSITFQQSPVAASFLRMTGVIDRLNVTYRNPDAS